MNTIISLDEFKRLTNKSHGRFRGANIEAIDTAMERYRDSGKPTKEPGVTGHLGVLHGIVDACLKWLKLKEGKSTTKKTFFGGTKESTLFKTRKEEITKLANSALGNIRELLRKNPQYVSESLGKFHFNASKLTALGVQPTPTNRTGFVKSLANGYQHERTTYVDSKKKTPHHGTAISANHIHDYHKQAKGDLQVNQLSVADQFNTTRTVNKLVKVLAKDVNSLSADDFRLLDQIARAGGDHHFNKGFDFIAKRERYKFMAIPENGLLFNYAGDPMSTTQWHLGKEEFVEFCHMYAMDKYGNLIVKIEGAIEPKKRAADENRFNHSSFNAGGDVVCAGMITITNGQLVHIDNSSGHYKPTRENLHNCVKILREDGIDLSQTRVGIIEYKQRGATLFEEFGDYNGARFADNINCNPNVGTFYMKNLTTGEMFQNKKVGT